MKKNGNFADILKEVQPLKQEASGQMVGGFTPFGGQNTQQQQTLQTVIMNGVDHCIRDCLTKCRGPGTATLLKLSIL